jgi:hypothetical protein
MSSLRKLVLGLAIATGVGCWMTSDIQHAHAGQCLYILRGPFTNAADLRAEANSLSPSGWSAGYYERDPRWFIPGYEICGWRGPGLYWTNVV